MFGDGGGGVIGCVRLNAVATGERGFSSIEDVD
jgi:hypothetical protein